jgi:hypothetical protein
MGLNYSRAKRKAQGRHGEYNSPKRWNTAGRRTEWPEEFPVTVTSVDCRRPATVEEPKPDKGRCTMTLRAKDYNGFTPDELDEAFGIPRAELLAKAVAA